MLFLFIHVIKQQYHPGMYAVEFISETDPRLERWNVNLVDVNFDAHRVIKVMSGDVGAVMKNVYDDRDVDVNASKRNHPSTATEGEPEHQPPRP